MSVAGLGLGRDTDVIGAYAAYGLGINIIDLIIDIITVKFKRIVYREIREYLIGLDDRNHQVKFEDRMFIVREED